MKDVPHHMAKFLKDYTKKETPEEDSSMHAYDKEHPTHQLKKQKKARKRQEKIIQTPAPTTPEECNKKMKKRTPQIRDRSHKTNF